MYNRVLSISDRVMRQKYRKMTLFNSRKKSLCQVEKLTSTPVAMFNVEYQFRLEERCLKIDKFFVIALKKIHYLMCY